jgi:hypothetical protein
VNQNHRRKFADTGAADNAKSAIYQIDFVHKQTNSVDWQNRSKEKHDLTAKIFSRIADGKSQAQLETSSTALPSSSQEEDLQ